MAPFERGPIKAGQEGIGFLVNQTTRAFDAHIALAINQFNLTVPGYVVLRHVLREASLYPAGVPADELARKLQLPETQVVESSERLARDGWLRLSTAAGTVLATPTHKAIVAEPVLVDASRWMLEEALNGLSHEEIATLADLLTRILQNLHASLGEDEGPLVP